VSEGRWRGARAATAGVVAAVVVGACAFAPPPPDWQLNAKAAVDRAVAAQLTGNARVEATEVARARHEISRTGRPDLLARVELTFCAARVASLAFDLCPAFESLRVDAPPAARAYADYLEARVQSQEIVLLPPAHRRVAASIIEGHTAAVALQEIDDPLSKLVAAGVLLRSGRATPAVIALAVETSSAQGWRRPLLAWLSVQLALAEKAGAAAEIERLKRRISVVQGDDAERGDSPSIGPRP